MHKQSNQKMMDIRHHHKSRQELLETTRLAKFRLSRGRELLSTDLSHSPELSELTVSEQSMTIPTNVCRVCEKEKLEADNELQLRTKVCRKCIEHYAIVDAAFNTAADAKSQAV